MLRVTLPKKQWGLEQWFSKSGPWTTASSQQILHRTEYYMSAHLMQAFTFFLTPNTHSKHSTSPNILSQPIEKQQLAEPWRSLGVWLPWTFTSLMLLSSPPPGTRMYQYDKIIFEYAQDLENTILWHKYGTSPLHAGKKCKSAIFDGLRSTGL